ncbi:DUF4190 domain-containing protein [Cryobacterium sandaracinum]|uniref:DUF4190 domain-containing protein n=1 Tax=Cryobacterium sandaracinum TaxID=1259247 RepID=UPI0015824DB6|nr:DUF4190 domain-containing protein [Cryobacterium sandaracinum]
MRQSHEAVLINNDGRFRTHFSKNEMSNRQMSSYPQQQIIYQQVIKAPTNGMAITSLVLGIVAIITGIWIPIPILGLFMMFLAFLPAVLAVIFGHVGLRNATRLGGIGRGASLTGLILGYITLGISVITTFLWIVTAAAASSSGQ